MQSFINAWQTVLTSFQELTVLDVADILLVAFAIYQVLRLTWHTRANQVLKGFGLVLLASQISRWIGLTATTWIFDYIVNNLVIILVILFQPEFRRVLEHMGQGKFFKGSRREHEEAQAEAVGEIVRAVTDMAREKTGALLVIQRKTQMDDIIETGTRVDGRVSRALLENIFVVNTPLHDGATLINGERILASGCILPVTNQNLSQDLGTRHRAGVGLSEVSDAMIIIVSEETGVVSIAEGGNLERMIQPDELKKRLDEIYMVPEKSKNLLDWFTAKIGGKE